MPKYSSQHCQVTRVSKLTGIEKTPYPITHPHANVCKEDECEICGVRDCPNGNPLHYHHDGCPVCTQFFVEKDATA